ncbi:MAG: glutamine synthetase beta-grasp domain-containing protein [Proteobacteria bacterium]|nr:glutamine synthetase beta-grasp domain-containing protein [Pseudomonadota bacterium]
MTSQAEYIWLDGATPTQRLRSKTRFIEPPAQPHVGVGSFPVWNFDGSSTYQAKGADSDLTLQPVAHAADPLRGDGCYLVMCEVLNGDGSPHATNQRAKLRRVLESGGAALEPWFGFEQEYTLFTGRNPLGWPDGGYPAPQGPFYCGVGCDHVYGRKLVEAHARACIQAGLLIYGINAEVMPGQWEFQIGHRGFEGETADPLTVSDHLWLARWLLARLGEDFGISVRLDNKPVKGDWNGAGAHTNFSTKATRDPKTGMAALEDAVTRLGDLHAEHIELYGHGLAERLTGLHETCAISEFRHGVADRGASVRIPRAVAARGHGYLEDRRPGANCDPYLVCAAIITTVCGMDVGKLAA